MSASICHGKANSRGWQIQNLIVTTVSWLLIKMLLGHWSPGGSFIYRSWILLGLLLPSWSIYVKKKIRLQWIFPSEQPKPNLHRYHCPQLNSPDLSPLWAHSTSTHTKKSFCCDGPDSESHLLLLHFQKSPGCIAAGSSIVRSDFLSLKSIVKHRMKTVCFLSCGNCI